MNLFFSTFCWLSSGLYVWESLWNTWAQYPCFEDLSPFTRQESKRHTVRPWLPRLCYFHELFTLNNHKWFRVSYNSNWSDQIMYKWHSEIPLCNFPRYQWNLAFNFGMTILSCIRDIVFFQCTTILYICIVSLNLYVYLYGASLIAQLVKNLLTKQETWVWSLVWENPLEKGKATHYSGLENSMDCIELDMTEHTYMPARRSNQSILKEINSEYLLEGLILKLMLQQFGHLMRRVDSLEKTLMLGKTEGKGDRGSKE